MEVLKLLQESYLGKVKMIYIDPPYNTGNDFIYADNFMHSQEEENQQMGMYDEETGDRLFKNTDTNGRFHSDWCSMIYSRLMLARNLLTDDGVIFISIDDNEQENLKKCCDEVFGTRCFWQHLCGNVEHLHNLIKVNVTQITNMFLHIQGKHFKLFVASTKIIKDILIRITILVARGQQTGKVYKPNYNRVWSYIPGSMAQLIAENRIVFPEDTSKRPMKKRFKRQS